MRAMAPHARQRLPVRDGASVSPPALRHRALAYRLLRQPARRLRVVAALLWVYRLLFVQPVGRRAREERLRALPGRTLRDIGLRRADVQAAAFGMLRLSEIVRYPRAGPLCVCGRPGFRPVLVRLSEAA